MYNNNTRNGSPSVHIHRCNTSILCVGITNILYGPLIGCDRDENAASSTTTFLALFIAAQYVATYIRPTVLPLVGLSRVLDVLIICIFLMPLNNAVK